jgi:PAS domain-containing protein
MPTSRLDARFCEVMDATPVMIWMSGTDKGCVWFNRPWLTFTGRSLAKEKGQGWSEGVVCTENSNSDIMVMQSAKDRVGMDTSSSLNWARERRVLI